MSRCGNIRFKSLLASRWRCWSPALPARWRNPQLWPSAFSSGTWAVACNKPVKVTLAGYFSSSLWIQSSLVDCSSIVQSVQMSELLPRFGIFLPLLSWRTAALSTREIHGRWGERTPFNPGSCCLCLFNGEHRPLGSHFPLISYYTSQVQKYSLFSVEKSQRQKK
jgi:hypothetical protein